ncbi:MAG: acetyl-CoA carboxylase biotin carboxyl carrier protein [Gemmatimonadaceae bacterium]|nr:acetyl-CoA carboxylase biotin carboxyl carrier protein [Gemmatimonadaceae bacterium]
MIDLRYVKKLIEMLDGSTVDSVEISSDKGMKIRISKTPQQRGAVQIPTPVAMPALMPSSPVGRMTPTEPVPAIAEPEVATRSEAPRANLLEVKSPMVGTYYAQPEPGAKPYVSVGQRIEKGETLCIIEAMKIMNEIESEFSGVVKEIVTSDSQPVEYGQVLMRIDPNG